MVSRSSVSEITKRAKIFFQNNFNFRKFDDSQSELLRQYLINEYELIPEKERIGKGMIYIVKIVAKVLYKHIKSNYFNFFGEDQPSSEFIKLILGFVETIEADEELIRLAIHVTANLAEDSFENTVDKVREWAVDENWEIRENACYPIKFGLKNNKTQVIDLLWKFAKDENENIRRLAAESLRPLADIKWLRDPSKNDRVLEILTTLNHDNSIYVRKSVGNNLKDLTKYMPEKILSLIGIWLENKEKLDPKGQRNLIWTIYHALRWLKAKKSEFHGEIERLIGENYILYYDEKRNRRALPPSKKS